MTHRHGPILVGPPHAVTIPGGRLKTRLLLGLVRLALAVVFLLAAFLILVLVGIYMVFEWIFLQVHDAIRRDHRYLGRPPALRLP